jgi:hypothetical protein
MEIERQDLHAWISEVHDRVDARRDRRQGCCTSETTDTATVSASVVTGSWSHETPQGIACGAHPASSGDDFTRRVSETAFLTRATQQNLLNILYIGNPRMDLAGTPGQNFHHSRVALGQVESRSVRDGFMMSHTISDPAHPFVPRAQRIAVIADRFGGINVRKDGAEVAIPEIGIMPLSEHLLPECHFQFGNHLARCRMETALLLEIFPCAVPGGPVRASVTRRGWKFRVEGGVVSPIRSVDLGHSIAHSIPYGDFENVHHSPQGRSDLGIPSIEPKSSSQRILALIAGDQRRVI